MFPLVYHRLREAVISWRFVYHCV